MALGDVRQKERSEKQRDAVKIRVPKFRISFQQAVTVLSIALVIAVILAYWPSGDGRAVKTTSYTKENGHVILIEEVDGRTGMINDPECPKCKENLEREISRQLRGALDTMTFKIVDE